MEMLIIAVVAIVAFAAVLIPLFRRRPDEHEAAEFDAGGEARSARPTEEVDVVPPMAAGPATPVAAGIGADAAAAHTSDAAPAEAAAEDDVEIEVQRYRAALRAGTLCSKCGQANPAESKFCFDCGAALPLTEAREFD
jgi:cell division septation protein DedD